MSTLFSFTIVNYKQTYNYITGGILVWMKQEPEIDCREIIAKSQQSKFLT